MRPRPGERVSRYHVEITCPRCGDYLNHQADAARPSGQESRAVATCESCRRYYVISVTIADATADIDHERRRLRSADGNGHHGTYTCYCAGCRCPQCRRANADAQARNRANKRKGAAA